MFKIFIFYFIHSFFFFFFYLFILYFMYKKEVTSAWNPSNPKILREKEKSSLKFKAKNWDFGRKEWNNYRCKGKIKKAKGREKKSEKAYHKREGTKNLCFPWLQMKIIFIEYATREREIVFQNFFLENNL